MRINLYLNTHIYGDEVTFNNIPATKINQLIKLIFVSKKSQQKKIILKKEM